VDDAPSATEVVEHEVRVAAPPEVVFEYFTDPLKIVSWMGDEATLDPRPGGVCRVEINGSRMLGEFTDVDFPTRIAFTWGFEQQLFGVAPQTTAVEVSLVRVSDGTLVRLAHRGLPGGAVLFHRAGWRHYLARLETALAGGVPGPDPWADVATAARAIAEAADE
jgi:uncharacterized protein YndB with AHSA1/START domain